MVNFEVVSKMAVSTCGAKHLAKSRPVVNAATYTPEILEFYPSTLLCFALQSCVVAMLLLARGLVPRSHFLTRRSRSVKVQAQKPPFAGAAPLSLSELFGGES
jgi:hypothetical protein